MEANRHKLNFEKLVVAIRQAHEYMTAQAGRAINISLTLRNWAIGCYIREYEQSGADRAQYGAQVLEYLGQELQKSLDKSYTARYLRLCRQMYVTYPHIRKSLISKFEPLVKGKSLISELYALSETDESNIVGAPSTGFLIPGDQLVDRLSFTHFVELIKLDDPLKRAFYEIECICGNWSVRELKRQIGSLYYERSGLSKDKKKLAALAQEGADITEPRLTIRDPYIFEFLGLKPKEVMSESHLEDQLLDKLQGFLLELGHGFCFEARQKRILIGDIHYFVDLVFYHRVLKCHVLVELKLEQFSHANIGQLNTYVSWYRKNMMSEGDNPPIGILLCTQRATERLWNMHWPGWITVYSFPNTSSNYRKRRKCNALLKSRSEMQDRDAVHWINCQGTKIFRFGKKLQQGFMVDLNLRRLIVIDVETTGLSPHRGDRIIEVGALALEGGACAGEFYSLVDAGRRIPPGARKINDITDVMHKDAPGADEPSTTT